MLGKAGAFLERPNTAVQKVPCVQKAGNTGNFSSPNCTLVMIAIDAVVIHFEPVSILSRNP